MASPCFFCGRRSERGLCGLCAITWQRAHEKRDAEVLFSEGAFTLFDYDEPMVRRALFAMKTQGTRACVRLFGEATAAALKEEEARFDAVCYVPRRRGVFRALGVDQAKLLARFVARRLGIKARGFVLRRGRARRQHGLRAEERAENVRGKFKAKRTVQGLRLLLIDDVITTGATACEVCRVLQSAGALSVSVASPVRGGL